MSPEVIRERLTSRLTVTKLAELLGVDTSAVSHKLAGRRRWTLEEARLIAAHFREHFDPEATVESLFGSEAA